MLVGEARRYRIIASLLHAPVFCYRGDPPARVVKLVDAGDSKSPAARRAGSIPAPGTTLKIPVNTSP